MNHVTCKRVCLFGQGTGVSLINSARLDLAQQSPFGPQGIHQVGPMPLYTSFQSGSSSLVPEFTWIAMVCGCCPVRACKNCPRAFSVVAARFDLARPDGRHPGPPDPCFWISGTPTSLSVSFILGNGPGNAFGVDLAAVTCSTFFHFVRLHDILATPRDPRKSKRIIFWYRFRFVMGLSYKLGLHILFESGCRFSSDSPPSKCAW